MFEKLGSKALLSVSRMTPIDEKYENVTWYRKRWFMVVTIIFFLPATLLIAATGDIYAKTNGVVYSAGPEVKKRLLLVSGLMLAFLVVKALIPVLIQPSF